MLDDEARPPEGSVTSTVIHPVAFFETDAMGVVHHANYLRFFELARTRWLEEHDEPYMRYIERGIHLAVTRSEVDYHQSARFADTLEVTTWLAWIRGASLGMDYRLEVDGTLIASGRTEHAALDDDGRVRRIPRDTRNRLRALCPMAGGAPISQ